MSVDQNHSRLLVRFLWYSEDNQIQINLQSSQVVKSRVKKNKQLCEVFSVQQSHMNITKDHGNTNIKIFKNRKVLM